MTTAVETPKARGIDMKLEVVVIPVSDIDRTKRFYSSLGWRLTPTSPPPATSA
jgi:predicted enzyme related to lactoylglutathione lyase